MLKKQKQGKTTKDTVIHTQEEYSKWEQCVWLWRREKGYYGEKLNGKKAKNWTGVKINKKYIQHFV